MNWLKAIGLFIGTAGLSSLLMAQAVTNVLENDQPILAASVFPLNGFALERIALSRFQNEGGGSIAPLVKQAVRKEPLSPTAWTILALAQDQDTRKEAILLSASQINRRSLPLQSNLLLLYASRGEVFNSMEVMHQILAVHPEQQETLFPILIQALKDENSIPEFTQALSRKPGRADRFLVAASRDSDALANLTRLRMDLFDKAVVEPDTDKAIIGGLSNAGRLDSAAILYQKISEPSSGDVSGAAKKRQRLDWSTRMPPFDWQLTNKPGQRAQVIDEPARLEFFVNRGKAGVLAERILTLPQSFTLEIEHNVSPAGQLEDVRVQLQCEKSKEKFLDEPFTRSPSKYSVGSISSDCAFVRLSLLARAWSDKADLSGTVNSVVIDPR